MKILSFNSKRPLSFVWRIGLVGLIFGFQLGSKSVEAGPSDADYFSGQKACFLLYNMKTKKFEKVIGEETCRERFVACSTFKVPLAVMAFDSGVLKDENQVLKWDGKKGYLSSHNQDHNAKTWMRDSVVWFSQRLTPQIGKERLEKYLRSFHYGNADFSGGITQAWLVSPGESTPALKISAYEQVEFMKSLWTDQLPVSKRAAKTTREITYIETSPKGFKLSGKTGSNFFDKDFGKDKRRGFGWFISHLEKDNQEYITVANISDLTPTEAGTEEKLMNFGGQRAKKITKEILLSLGRW